MSNSNWKIMEVDTINIKQNVQEMMKIILEQETENNIAMVQSNKKFDSPQLKDGTLFLPGSFGNDEKITRETNIKEDTSIMVLAASTDNSYSEHKNSKSIEDLKVRAKQIFDAHESVEVIVNGTLYNRENGLVMVETDPIKISFPHNNTYKEIGVEKGLTDVVCLAWVLVLKLKVGKHIIKIHSYHPSNQELNIGKFNTEVEYKINVIPKLQ